MHYLLKSAFVLAQCALWYWVVSTNKDALHCALASECDAYPVPEAEAEALATEWIHAADLRCIELTDGYLIGIDEMKAIRKQARAEAARRHALRQLFGRRVLL